MKINISFEVETPKLVDRERHFYFVRHPHLSAGVFASKPSSAARKLRAIVSKEIEEALRQRACGGRHIIKCRSGEIILVSYRGGWFYSIARDGWVGGECRAGSSVSFSTLADALAVARRHADSSYGGVEWEGRL